MGQDPHFFSLCSKVHRSGIAVVIPDLKSKFFGQIHQPIQGAADLLSKRRSLPCILQIDHAGDSDQFFQGLDHVLPVGLHKFIDSLLHFYFPSSP